MAPRRVMATLVFPEEALAVQGVPAVLVVPAAEHSSADC
jgi:hypothetical protein